MAIIFNKPIVTYPNSGINIPKLADMSSRYFHLDNSEYSEVCVLSSQASKVSEESNEVAQKIIGKVSYEEPSPHPYAWNIAKIITYCTIITPALMAIANIVLLKLLNHIDIEPLNQSETNTLKDVLFENFEDQITNDLTKIENESGIKNGDKISIIMENHAPQNTGSERIDITIDAPIEERWIQYHKADFFNDKIKESLDKWVLSLPLPCYSKVTVVHEKGR